MITLARARTAKVARFAPLALALAIIVPSAASLAGPTFAQPEKAKLPPGETLKATGQIGVEGRVLYIIPALLDPATGISVSPGIRTKPAALLAPMKLRIADVTENADGKGGRGYDLRFIGEVAGLHNLRDSLERIDLGSKRVLPSSFVRVTGYYTDDTFEGQLTDAALDPVPEAGGYRRLLRILAVVWTVPVVVGAVWAALRWKRKNAPVAAEAPRPTLAQQLSPLIDDILSGRATVEAKAKLEMLLLAHWRHTLGIEGRPMIAALETLRAHPQAGELLAALDSWLHMPERQRRPIDVRALLEPYRSVAAVNVGSWPRPTSETAAPVLVTSGGAP